MTNEEENNNKERRSLVDEDHLVTESLLSWAKDVRYVRRIQSLLADAVEPHFSGIVVSKGTWYTSYLLYVLLIVTRKGRTLGMQATGLQFAESRRVVDALLAIGISTWALDCWAMTGDRQSQRLSEAEGLRGSNRRRRHELLRQQMLQRASSSQSTVTHSNPSPHSSCNELSYWDRMAMNVRTLIKVGLHIHTYNQSLGEVLFSCLTLVDTTVLDTFHRRVNPRRSPQSTNPQ